MKRTPWILGLAVGGLLVGAICLQMGPARVAQTLPGKGKHLTSVIPDTLAGVPFRPLELGATENTRAVVERTLQYDDVLFQEYPLKAGVVSVYVAYWGPGRMPAQLVASHTPDRCWTENGWVCEQRKHGVNAGITAPNFLPAEWRLFSPPSGPKLHVIFWHLMDGVAYNYGERLNRMPSIWRWWRDAVNQMFRASPEQYFIRVSSEISFERLHGDPGWQELLAALAKLGLEGKGGGQKGKS